MAAVWILFVIHVYCNVSMFNTLYAINMTVPGGCTTELKCLILATFFLKFSTFKSRCIHFLFYSVHTICLLHEKKLIITIIFYQTDKMLFADFPLAPVERDTWW